MPPITMKPTLPKEWPSERIDNLISQASSERIEYPGAKHLQVELTNHCNLKCVECPQRLMDRLRQWMTIESFESILKLLSKYEFETVIPHKDGESLMHPFILPMIEAISKVHKNKFSIYTNGTHFTKEFYDLIRTLPNRFTVLMSFHYHGFKTGEFDCTETRDYSCDPAADTLMACLQEPADNVEFVIVSHITEHSHTKSMEEWKETWEKVRIEYPQLSAVHLNRHINPWAGHSRYGNVTFDSCPYGDGGHLFIGVTGNVVPCCMDLNEDLVLGNILETPMEDIIPGRAKFYENLLTPELRKPRCVQCIGGPK